MTGVIGFIIGALSIAAFAATANRAYIAVPLRRRQLFVIAFGTLAAAMLIWGLAVLADGTQSTRIFVLASDALLLTGTGCMLHILLDRTYIWLTVLMSLAGALLLGLRAFEYVPTAFVYDGLLYFNLSSGVRDALLGAFLAIWLPAVLVVSNELARDKTLQGLQNILASSFMAMILATTLFMAARRSVIIISLFAIIVVLFLVMTAANIVINKLHRKPGGDHAA